MTESSFDEFLEWLQANDGRSVYLEIGTDAPETTQPADAFPVGMHVTLNGIQSATNVDRPDCMAVRVRLDGDERTASTSSRIGSRRSSSTAG